MKVICEATKFQIVDDGKREFIRRPDIDSMVYVLLFRRRSDKPILGNYRTRSFRSKNPVLTSFSAEVYPGGVPGEVASKLAFEITGHTIAPGDMFDFGDVWMCRDDTTRCWLFGADFTDMQGNSDFDDESGNVRWVSLRQALKSKSPIQIALSAKVLPLLIESTFRHWSAMQLLERLAGATGGR